MPFTATPMFPGDLYDTMDHMAATAAPVRSENQKDQASATWQQILALGWQGVVIEENSGGVGAALADFAAIAEAAGRHAVALPLIARCVVAPMLLAAAQPGSARGLLERVSAGQASVCPVIHASGDQKLRASKNSDGQYVLEGELRGADLTEPASHLAFNTFTGPDATPLLLLLTISKLPANTRYFKGIDGRRTADIPLSGVVVETDQVLRQGEAVHAVLQDAEATGAVMNCVQTVGALGAMIEQTITYLSTRVQFGAALSTFQVLRHRTVDMYVAFEGARGLVKQVVEAMSSEPMAKYAHHRDAALTKLYLTTVGRMVAESTIQLHGGMGMTVEMPAARLAIHTLMCNLQHGDRLHYLDHLSAQMAADLQACARSI
jgi:alkylation response protein AidB-like acyl-CoA dehydrogenase